MQCWARERRITGLTNHSSAKKLKHAAHAQKSSSPALLSRQTARARASLLADASASCVSALLAAAARQSKTRQQHWMATTKHAPAACVMVRTEPGPSTTKQQASCTTAATSMHDSGGRTWRGHETGGLSHVRDAHVMQRQSVTAAATQRQHSLLRQDEWPSSTQAGRMTQQHWLKTHPTHNNSTVLHSPATPPPPRASWRPATAGAAPARAAARAPGAAGPAPSRAARPGGLRCLAAAAAGGRWRCT